jgi:hypothetical protein
VPFGSLLRALAFVAGVGKALRPDNARLLRANPVLPVPEGAQ